MGKGSNKFSIWDMLYEDGLLIVLWSGWKLCKESSIMKLLSKLPGLMGSSWIWGGRLRMYWLMVILCLFILRKMSSLLIWAGESDIIINLVNHYMEVFKLMIGVFGGLILLAARFSTNPMLYYPYTQIF